MSELRDITIAEKAVPTDEIVALLSEHLTSTERLRLTTISFSRVASAAFLAKVMKRENFADVPDLVSWVRKALEDS